MDACERCGVKGYEEHTDQAKLVGGFEANLCNRCINEWTDHLEATPEWSDHKKNTIDLNLIFLEATAGIAPDPGKHESLCLNRVELETTLRAVGKEFVATGVKVAVED